MTAKNDEMKDSDPLPSTRAGDWQCTYTGTEFYPLDPRPEEVHLVDIAHALSNMCRFAGHTRVFYSVAEHSIRVSQVVAELWGHRAGQSNAALAGLLHDASEAYLVDVPRPIKRLELMHQYRVHEALLQQCIYRALGVKMSPELEEIVRVADDEMLATERRDLMPHFTPEGTASSVWAGLPPPRSNERINRTLPPSEGKAAFRARFTILTRHLRNATRTSLEPL